MINSLWLLLLPVAATAGFLLAYVKRHHHHREATKNVSKNYLQGLNYLLNEEPDKAVDVFVNMLQIDSDTLETHLALGNLFRRRGEVNRAIRIHQNLIDRPSLTKKDRGEALFSLGCDYLSAGVLDRAEGLFLELVALKVHSTASLRCLLDIYQQEKEWHKAIEVAQKLEHEAKISMQKEIAHYYCELAEILMDEGSRDQAYKYLKKALSTDQCCVRASLLLGSLEYVSGRHKHAVRLYKQVREQGPDFLSEAVVPLAEAYQALGEDEALEFFIRKTMKNFPDTPIVLLLSEKIRGWRGDKEAAQFVFDYVREHPSVSGLYHLVDLYIGLREGRAKQDLLLMRRLLEKLMTEQPHYQCAACGFTSKSINWLCPSCKRWGTTKSAHLCEVSHSIA